MQSLMPHVPREVPAVLIALCSGVLCSTACTLYCAVLCGPIFYPAAFSHNITRDASTNCNRVGLFNTQLAGGRSSLYQPVTRGTYPIQLNRTSYRKPCASTNSCINVLSWLCSTLTHKGPLHLHELLILLLSPFVPSRWYAELWRQVSSCLLASLASGADSWRRRRGWRGRRWGRALCA